MPLSVPDIYNLEIPHNALVKKVNIETRGMFTALALNQANNLETDMGKKEIAQILKAREMRANANAIDVYFARRDMPLEGTGAKMVEEAEKNNLDWRLLPAIAVRESTGGKNDCKKVLNNAFGWGSCKISFKSNGEAIEVIAKNLGGNNPNTAKHYDNKTTKQILRAYNPPSVIPKYSEQVMSIMNAIGDSGATKTNAVAVNT